MHDQIMTNMCQPKRVEIIKREEHPSLVSTQLRNKTFNEILYLVSKRIDELREERPD